MRVKEYERETLGLVVRGSLYDTDPAMKNEALYQIASKAPEHCVIIPSTVKTRVYFEIEEPHPDCKACHCQVQPVWYTAITVKAFPMVLPEHVAAVRSLGDHVAVVRVPLYEPITAAMLKEADDYIL